MRIVFYQNMAGPHQADTIRAQREVHGIDVRVVVDRMSEAHRTAMGWRSPNFGTVDVVEPKSVDAFTRELDRSGTSDTVHIFSGFGACPRVAGALSCAVRKGLRVAVFAESRRGVTWRAPFRDMGTLWDALRWGPRIQFLLTTGDLGVRWYSARGFDAATVFNFGYFIDTPSVPAIPDSTRTGRPVRPISVGVVTYNRVLMVIHALARWHERDWTLEVVGDGEDRSRAEALA